jgi:CheY-like chemotaxis protein/transcriptional regulator with XRE-family HTH domain
MTKKVLYKVERCFLDTDMVKSPNFPSAKELFKLARAVADKVELISTDRLSDADLGRRIGFESARTSRWKHGQIAVSDSARLIALSQALDIDLTVLSHVAAGYITSDEALEILSDANNLVRFLGDQMVLPADNQSLSLVSDNTRFKIIRRSPSHYRRQPKGVTKEGAVEAEDIPAALLVDDSQTAIRNFRNLTGEGTGIEGVVARTGCEGLVAAGKYQPQIVIFDLFIGQVDGFAAIRSISENETTSEAEVYASSTILTPDIVRTAMGSGARDVLQRPLNSKTLATLVGRARNR